MTKSQANNGACSLSLDSLIQRHLHGIKVDKPTLFPGFRTSYQNSPHKLAPTDQCSVV